MGADKSAQNNSNAPKFICPICLPQAQKFGILIKTTSLGVRSPCYRALACTRTFVPFDPCVMIPNPSVKCTLEFDGDSI